MLGSAAARGVSRAGEPRTHLGEQSRAEAATTRPTVVAASTRRGSPRQGDALDCENMPACQRLVPRAVVIRAAA